MSTTEGGLRVPGATLHYRVSGSGPMLLLVLKTHAEDAHVLLEAFSGDPVLVFGGSLGGLIGLDLSRGTQSRYGRSSSTSRPRPSC